MIECFEGSDGYRHPGQTRLLLTGLEIAAVVGAVASVVGTVVQQVSAASQAKGAAKMAERDAEQARVNAEAQAEDAARTNERTRDRQKVLLSSSGVQAIGSPLEVMYDSAKEAELEIERIKSGAAQYGASRQFQANMYRSEASGYRTGAAISGAGGVLGGLYSAYGNKKVPFAGQKADVSWSGY